MLQAINPHDLRTPPKWTSKGAKQRTHLVTIKDENVYVKLSDLSKPYESDHYYTEMSKTLAN